MNKMLLIINSGLLFVYASFCNAQEIITDLTSSDVTLIIKPNICVASRGEKNCISSFDISWSSKHTGNYCLGVANEQQNLKCWQAADSGFYRHKTSIYEDLSYWLTSMVTDIQLAKSTVKFAALKPHRKHGRRSRLPWSIQAL